MEYAKLGQTGLEVSRICLECMSYGVPDREVVMNEIDNSLRWLGTDYVDLYQFHH
ncbi:hypothetical protein DFP97_113135 [Paenibacillus prosopidis]|uniref:Aldo/keto reductase family protein n=1 Tax=Paenibacillus prosopidis TaxID=630520 RepID=A0A368VRH9_9BACL|nr:hypothetical protein DFP97_113135 [Paenibacillus prosopidis]